MIISGQYVDVRKIIEALGLDIKGESGDELLLDCLWHDDGGANLSINVAKGVYKCWVCYNDNPMARGNLISFVANVRSITRFEATEFILERSVLADPADLLRHVKDAFRSRFRRPKSEPIWNEVDRYFAPRHPFWKERGIRRRTAEKFLLGFDARRNHAIIPISIDGEPVALIRRVIGATKRRYLMPKGFEKENVLFGLDRCKGNGLYICEGAIDAMKVHQAGYNGVAVLGNSMSQKQSDMLLEYGPEYLVLMTDADLGGGLLSKQVWESIPYRSIYYVEYPEGRNDPGACNSDEIWEMVMTKQHVLKGLYLQRGLRQRSERA